MIDFLKTSACIMAIGLAAGCASSGGYYSGNTVGVAVSDECSGRYPGAYCGYPTLSGSVIIRGQEYRGLHYRDGRDGREYWRDGEWHLADR